MRIRILTLPGDVVGEVQSGKFALVVDRLNPDHLDSEAAVDAIEHLGAFAQTIGAAGCLVSVEDVELPAADLVLADEHDPLPAEPARPEVRPCTPRRMAVEIVGHGELAIPSGDVARKLYVSLDGSRPYLSVSRSEEALAVVEVPRSANVVTANMISPISPAEPQLAASGAVS